MELVFIILIVVAIVAVFLLEREKYRAAKKARRADFLSTLMRGDQVAVDQFMMTQVNKYIRNYDRDE
jgi:preprotein translocase subunit YajC